MDRSGMSATEKRKEEAELQRGESVSLCPRPLPRVGAQAQLHIAAAESMTTMLSGSRFRRRRSSFSSRRRRRTHNHPFGVSVSQPVSQSVRLQSIRTDCLAVGKERDSPRPPAVGRGVEGRASEEYLSHGTKGRRMMTPSRLGS